MAAKNYATPPELRENIAWLDFKKELAIWQALTDLPNTKQGLAFFLSLKGKARETALEVGVDDMKKEDGIKKILERLDKLYLQDTNQSAYLAYQTFENFKRSKDTPMKDYLIQFEKLYNKIKDHNMELPDGVLAYRVLNSADLSEEEMKLCRATLNKLEYAEMTKQLMKIFGDTVSPSFSVPEVKSEPVFYSYSQRGDRGWNRGSSRGACFRESGRGYRGGGYNYSESSVRKLNPPDNDGKPSRCAICDSKFHWARKCPDAYENNNQGTPSDTTQKISLFQSSDNNVEEMKVFVGETFDCAVLDSGCTQTVCGTNWLACFNESLSDKEIITEEQSTTVFKFGNGPPVTSKKKVCLPVVIGSKDVSLKTDVVDLEIPLLLSRGAMKKAKANINFDRDTVSLFGEEQKLLETSSGHYAIPITKRRKIVENLNKSDYNIEKRLCFVTSDIIRTQDKDKMVTKLHRQFCHCSADKLKMLIKSSELWKDDPEILEKVDEISQKCQICKVYKRVSPRPIVGLPVASDFNHTVAMDLITYKQGTWILHIIDIFSRYSVACVRHSKKQDVIVDAILKTWISYFGPPRRFLADNGGEFSNEEYKEMCEMFNIEMAKTAAESPWSNGICERHNAVLKDSIRKTMEDTDCSLETAVVWAVSAKNTLHGHNGYSPNTIVFGRNPNMPSVLENHVPALHEVSTVTVENNLRAMHTAREAFIKCESSERIKRALNNNIRTCNDAQFQNGERVYYKRNDSPRWHGPGTVIGQEHKQILVKHGNENVRVHASRLMHVDNVNFHTYKNEDEILKVNPPNKSETTFELPIVTTKYDENGESEENIERLSQSLHDELEIHNDVSNVVMEDPVSEYQVMKQKITLPKVKTDIIYRLSDQEDWRRGTVYNRAGKVTGKYRNNLNIKDEETGNINEYDFSKDIAEWEQVIQENVKKKERGED